MDGGCSALLLRWLRFGLLDNDETRTARGDDAVQFFSRVLYIMAHGRMLDAYRRRAILPRSVAGGYDDLDEIAMAPYIIAGFGLHATAPRHRGHAAYPDVSPIARIIATPHEVYISGCIVPHRQ